MTLREEANQLINYLMNELVDPVLDSITLPENHGAYNSFVIVDESVNTYVPFTLKNCVNGNIIIDFRYEYKTEIKDFYELINTIAAFYSTWKHDIDVRNFLEALNEFEPQDETESTEEPDNYETLGLTREYFF